LLNRLKGIVGNRLNGIIYVMDLINACPLRCPTCAVSYNYQNGKIMPLDLFKRILDKAQRESKIRKLQLYIYSDPCLVKNLHEYLEVCRERGIKSSISTMLQRTNCDFEKVIEARPSEFRISFAGIKNLEVYQKGGKMENFIKKLDMVSRLPRYKETRWDMFFHVYRDNRDEIKLGKVIADYHKLDFIAYPAIFMVNERVVDKDYSKNDLKAIKLLLENPEENIKRLKFDKDYCLMQSKQICIDAEGMCFQCQIVYEDRFKLVPFLSVPLKDIRKMMERQEFCNKCKNVGGHAYQYLYGDSIKYKDPIKIADKRYAS
jgi:MoaA/NifB/PqqE/SkfB family radical SAM enzyme